MCFSIAKSLIFYGNATELSREKQIHLSGKCALTIAGKYRLLALPFCSGMTTSRRKWFDVPAWKLITVYLLPRFCAE
jgi:hypothetical protein